MYLLQAYTLFSTADCQQLHKAIDCDLSDFLFIAAARRRGNASTLFN